MEHYYVSTTGKDSGTGAKDMPVLSLEQALQFVADQRKAETFSGATIHMQTGFYPLDHSIQIDETNCGTSDAPLVIIGIDGPVTISGGRYLTKPMPVTDREVLSRIAVDVRTKLVQYNLKEEGIDDFGKHSSRGYTRPVTPSHLELFYNGEPMTLARYPNDGRYLFISGDPEAKDRDGFHYDSDRPETWKDDPEIRVHGYWLFDWANSCEKIDSIDKTNKRIQIASTPGGDHPQWTQRFKEGQRFFFLNVLEELDQPGEFYVDTEKGFLYFFPPDGLAEAEVIVSVAEFPLIKMNNARNVTISGIKFECGRADGFAVENYKDITIDSCCFRNFGNRAAIFHKGFGLSLLGSDFYNTGDGCVDIIAGDRATLTSGEVIIYDNHFHHFARWSKCYCTAINASGVGFHIHHNLFHDCPHSAILFHGNEYRIEFNEFYNVTQETGDCGAMYTGFDLTFRDIIINDNYYHNMGQHGPSDSFAIYCDACQGGTVIRNNYFQDIYCAISNNGGYNFEVIDNICVNTESFFVNFAAHGMHPGEAGRHDTDISLRNGFYAMKADEPPYSERYPDLKIFDKIFKEAAKEGKPAFIPPSIHIDGNILRNSEMMRRHWLVKDEMIQMGANQLDAQDIPQPPTETTGLTSEPRYSIPAKIFPELIQTNSELLRLTVINRSNQPVSAFMRLFNKQNEILDFEGNRFDFTLQPNETKSCDFKGAWIAGTYVEARSDTPGIRSARAYIK